MFSRVFPVIYIISSSETGLFTLIQRYNDICGNETSISHSRAMYIHTYIDLKHAVCNETI